MLYENLDFDPEVVAEIRSLRSAYNAGGYNRIYQLLDSSKSYRITVPSTEPVKKRLLHDVIRSILICNMLSELWNGPAIPLKVCDGLEDIKKDTMLLCEDYVNFFSTQYITHPKHKKCIELFKHIIEALASENRVEVGRAFELLE